MLLGVPSEEIALATAELQAASANGFSSSEALFRACACDEYGNLTLKFNGLIMKGHPTDPSKNWGNSGWLKICIPFYRSHRYVNGIIERIDQTR